MFHWTGLGVYLQKNAHFPGLKSKEFSVDFVEADIDRGAHWIWRDDFQCNERQKPAVGLFV